MGGFKINWDFMGIATSLACAIHCALLPLFLSSLPLFGINILENVFFEFGMIAIAFVVGYYSLLHGYKTHHRRVLPLVIFSIGMVFLVVKSFMEQPFEYGFLAVAVIAIITAHLLNYRYCNHSKTCSHHAH
jgi:MerC mercury resistance protein